MIATFPDHCLPSKGTCLPFWKSLQKSNFLFCGDTKTLSHIFHILAYNRPVYVSLQHFVLRMIQYCMQFMKNSAFTEYEFVAVLHQHSTSLESETCIKC